MGFVVARMAEHVGDAEPVTDATLSGQQVDSRAEAFERDVLRAYDHGVPGLVEVVGGVDQGLDVLLDGDAADVDDDFVFGCEAERRFEFVAIDQRVDSAGIGAVGDDDDVVSDSLGEVLADRFVHAYDGCAVEFVGSCRG